MGEEEGGKGGKLLQVLVFFAPFFVPGGHVLLFPGEEWRRRKKMQFPVSRRTSILSTRTCVQSCTRCSVLFVCRGVAGGFVQGEGTYATPVKHTSSTYE